MVKLQKMGVHTPQDLIFHLPLRYQDKTRITPISELQHGEPALILGQVESASVNYGRRRSLVVTLGDESGLILLRFFHFNYAQQQGFRTGCWVQAFGEPRYSLRSVDMVHPEYRVSDQPPDNIINTALSPLYPATEGVAPAKIAKLVAQAREQYGHDLVDLLPDKIRAEHNLMALETALETIHNPLPDEDTEALLQARHPAQKRLALEEMLAHHLALCQMRKRRISTAAPQINVPGASWNKLHDGLPFKLTHAQSVVISEIFADLKRAHPAIRLVQGDVGSGKTIVAAAAALNVIDAGYQVAMMAPTELLAEQHKKTFFEWFDPLNIGIESLSGKMPAASRRNSLQRIADGSAQFVVGTHALFQRQVLFQNIGLLIIDEQHRFGVDQRLALRQKGENAAVIPHQLIMSATPIPRSMAMILYADLDISSIDELPPGRKPVKTVVMQASRRIEVAMRIRAVCGAGQQAYWVCPLIEESDKLQAQAAATVYEELTLMLPEFKIELIHGRLKSKVKEEIMSAFKNADIDLLVSTTVIEVGVDVPNASLMVIENAERLGLAQLHQLRGRVGRGKDQAFCVLLYETPLGDMAKSRLSILRETNDGFAIARKDLENRGPGELMGTRQTGLQNMKIADLQRDQHLIPMIENISCYLNQNCAAVIPRIIERWINHADQYGDV